MSGILERIEQRLDRLERRLAKCEPPVGAGGMWVDQRQSPLGRRRHCAAVRRLAAAGDSRVFVNGRRHLMAPEALAEEMARLSLAPESASGRMRPQNDGASFLGASGEASADETYRRALDKALRAGGKA